MSKRNQQIGKTGENLADIRLRAIGLEMVEKIGTPVILQSLPKRAISALRKTGVNASMVFRVIFGEKVSGDRRAVVPISGRSVLIETKTIFDRNLRWSDLRKHQPERLDRHTELGGLSLIAWVNETGVYIMKWPIQDFGPGKSITVDIAKKLDIDRI